MEEKQAYTAPVCDITRLDCNDILTASIIMPPHIIGGSGTNSTQSGDRI